MRTRRISIVAGALAAGLLLAGCGGDAGSSAAGQMTAPSSEQAAPETPASTGEQESGQEGGGSAEQAADRCTTADLSATVNQPTGTGQQSTILAWRNTSDQPCTMTGFGGVDLRGPEDPTFGPSYSLPRSSEEATPVTLQPGGTGITTITTLSGGGWTPTEVVVTAPDETTSTTIPWRGGPVQRQDGATRPGSYIGPVEQGSV
ncbi:MULTISPECIES: DUF4232 domain-containing protein [unclassified Pseudonocardia]|uniref:DUF4232 domain-containing protein n=1 Tax=unclassified Pseudonocardia TaxID=2619320 RepID=UPI00031E0487|nr:DUF4232 domain-containing protein [Pseudonocardia sp. Ae707_Ps1]OLM17442.1 putative lipoprotein [Pseudonocardia sp. Ae707_Ps1]